MFDLAIETSLRQGMLFKLHWDWISLEKRMIAIPLEYRAIGNKGVPAILPLSTHAVAVLSALPRSIDGRVCPITQNALVCVWKRAMKRLGIAGLHWHDLRHEAASRLFEKGFNPFEVASITGHKSMQMLKHYTHLRPENLLARLG
ncbi:MAG: rci [Rhodocyclales bacterium]|nr:rci [Rhodocyclales bacterium]